MRTDPDGLPHRDDRLKLADALRRVLAEKLPDADPEIAPDIAAAVGAMAASRFFGVRFRAEGNAERAWVARRPNPDVCEVWDPLAATMTWDFAEKLPEPGLYRPTPEGTARVANRAQGAMTVIIEAARAVQAMAGGIDEEDA